MKTKLPTNVNLKDIDKGDPISTCHNGSIGSLGCAEINCSECALFSKESYAMHLKDQEPETKWVLADANLIPHQALSYLITIGLYDNETLVMVYAETNKPVLKTDDHLSDDIDFSGWH